MLRPPLKMDLHLYLLPLKVWKKNDTKMPPPFETIYTKSDALKVKYLDQFNTIKLFTDLSNVCK